MRISCVTFTDDYFLQIINQKLKITIHLFFNFNRLEIKFKNCHKKIQKKFQKCEIIKHRKINFIKNKTKIESIDDSMEYKSEKHEKNLKAFLKKYEKHLSNEVKQLRDTKEGGHHLENIRATILSDNDEKALQEASLRLNEGGLVAFPTETVYGLGGSALNENALLKIYQTKRRPLSDPIIVHILEPHDAFKYVEISKQQRVYFQILTKAFWPGPLTVILKANLDVLPMVVTAQTGFVGIRCPNHPYFRKLLKKSNLPIGAPSANLFSHVSPTEAVHVFNDFYKDDVWIVDGGKCQFGIESTVLKILDNEIKIFREGSLCSKKIQEALDKELGEKSPKVQVVRKTAKHEENTEAPGQLLKHYSPHLPCEYVESPYELQKLSDKELQKIGLISFDHELYSSLQKKLGVYFEVGKILDLPVCSQTEEEQKFCSLKDKIKMREIYFLLREAENLPLNKIIIGWNGPKEGTIWDKIFRATQGKKFVIN